jgi:tetratricopeptide (TPR) repeat protein
MRRPLTVAAGLAIILCAIAAWRQTGYWADSRTLFTRTLEVTDDNWMIHNNLGVALGQQGDYREAGLHFLRVIEINPDDAMARGNLLFTVERMREGGASVDADLLSAVARMLERERAEPGAADWPFNLGVLYRRLGEFERAIAHFEEAIRLAPGDVEARLRLGGAHQDRGNAMEALRWYRLALQRGGDDPAAIKTLAWFLATQPRDDLRDGAEAGRLAERARVVTEGRDPEAMVVLAAALAESGRFDDARMLLSPLLEAGPEVLRPEWLERARELAAAIDRGRALRSDASIWR